MPNAALYGFHNLTNVWDLPTTEVDARLIDDAIVAARNYHNTNTNAALDLFVQRTTEFKLAFRSRSGTRNQPIDEIGRTNPVRVTSDKYDIGLPYIRSGNSWGIDWETRLRLPVSEINDLYSEILTGDRIWLREQIFAAMFNPTPWTFEDPNYGNLNVVPLANNDTVKYLRKGLLTTATDNHFKAQAAAIADASNPFPIARAELVEHPENGLNPVVVHFIASNLVTTAEGLATFYEQSDPNIDDPSAARLVGRLPATVPGNVLGYDQAGGGSWIVEWPEMPSDYIISITTTGDRPLAMREDPLPRLRGFITVAEMEMYPWYKQEFRRHAGFGAWNRVGAVVTRIGDGTYAVPTGYALADV